MQTFLTYSCFKMSAKCLDNKRSGKQRVETLQLVRGLKGYSDNGYLNHPASIMWSNHVDALIKYGLIVCLDWIERGFNDTCFDKLLSLSTLSYSELMSPSLPMPSWLGNPKLHESHQSNLLKKDEAYYSQFKWTVPNNLPYWWPGPG